MKDTIRDEMLEDFPEWLKAREPYVYAGAPNVESAIYKTNYERVPYRKAPKPVPVREERYPDVVLARKMRLAEALMLAKEAHAEYEKEHSEAHSWTEWYADWLVSRYLSL
jgi:hypothetical protein